MQKLIVLCLIVFLSCVVSTFAEQHGQLSLNGAPVPGATVTVTQGDKTFVAITDLMGVYSFPDLPEGRWPVEIEMLGLARLSGDTSTTVWEFKVLPMEEIHTEIVHNAPASGASASSPATVTPSV